MKERDGERSGGVRKGRLGGWVVGMGGWGYVGGWVGVGGWVRTYFKVRGGRQACMKRIQACIQ